jgi:hypothetical protein
MRVAVSLLLALAVAAVVFAIAHAFGAFVILLPFVFVPFVWRRGRRQS